MSAIESDPEKEPSSEQLRDRIGKVFIIAYKEPTELLETALAKEGFDCEVLRQQDAPERRNFSPSFRCMLNHCSAWEKAMSETKPTLVVEADFVPVVGLGKLPAPFPSDRTDMGISWLYTCAPQVYSISDDGYAEGFSTAMVAYIITSHSARYLRELVTDIQEKIGAENYSAWDSEIDSFLRDRNLKNYIPFRNYGEHGGRPNPEHRQNQLSASHRADVLYGKLAFLPLYASEKNGGSLNFLGVRLKARLKGIGRLAMGRYIRMEVLKKSSVPGRILGFAIRRQLSLRL